MKIKKYIGNIKEQRLYLIVALIIFVLDFISKYFVQKYLAPIGVKKILGDFLIFIYTENYGVAFGMFNNVPEAVSRISEAIIPIIVGAAIVLIFVFMCSLDKKKYRVSLIALTMILGGALGNFVDRIMRGYVTDFINMGLNENIRFNYNYNIADASITIGFVVMLIALFVFREDSKNKKAK